MTSTDTIENRFDVDIATPQPPQQLSTIHPASPNNKSVRSCRACGHLCVKRNGPLVKALGEIYHYQCFVCEDCHKLVADKFYALEIKNDYLIVCEQHYYSRLGLVCKQCHQPIFGPVEPGLEYHLECLQCPDCVANEQQSEDGSCFEFHGQAYCRYHFSMIPDTHCAGCGQAILKQFVEHHSYPRKKWHPECYMIQKFWNIRLVDAMDVTQRDDPRSLTADRLRELQNTMETKVIRIWTDLSAFQESSATCISDMLFHIAAGAYMESMRMASQFILHLEVLFAALDNIGSISAEKGEELQCFIETRSICSQIISIFQLLTHDGNMGCTKTADTGVTQELLSLVTGMAQNLKSLIRIGLAQALRLETDHRIQDAISLFLSRLLPLENQRVWMAGRYWFKDESTNTMATHDNHSNNLETMIYQRNVSQCQHCHEAIEDECIRKGDLRWHISCFHCTRCHYQLAKELDRARLDETQLTLEHGVILFCNDCCTNKGCQYPPFRHMSRWEQCLDLVKSALGQLYTSPTEAGRIPDDTSRQTTLHDYETKINTAAKKSKRQSSLLRLMNRSTTRRQSLFGSVHLTHVKRTDNNTTTAPPPSSSTSSTSPTCSTPTWRWRYHQNQSPLTMKRASTIRETTSPINNNSTNTLGRFGSIRRALSTNRRERRPLHGVFDRYNNKKTHSTTVLDQQQQGQQASICTFDTFDATATIHSNTNYSNNHVMGGSSGDNALAIPGTTCQQHHSGDLTDIQDAVLRYMAALYLESLVRGSFSLEELVTLTETKRSSSSSSSLWYRLKTHIRVGGGGGGVGGGKHHQHHHYAAHLLSSSSYGGNHNNKTFGVPLIAIAKRDHHHRHQPASCFQDILSKGTHPLAPYYFSSNALVPTFMKNCILALCRMDMSLEGVFRKNGNVRELNEICDTVNRDATSLVYLDETPIQLAALLKRFLRDLPEPLLTFKLYDLLISSIHIQEESKSKKVLHLACCMLPKANRDTMQMLFLFLKWVATFHETNKMDVTNLARVIAPTVFYSSAATKELTVERQQSARDEIKVVEMLIRYQEEFCMVPQPLVGIVQDPKAVDYLGDPKQALRFLDYHNHHGLTSCHGNDENIGVPTPPSSPPPPPPPTASRSISPLTLRRSWIPKRD